MLNIEQDKLKETKIREKGFGSDRFLIVIPFGQPQPEEHCPIVINFDEPEVNIDLREVHVLQLQIPILGCF